MILGRSDDKNTCFKKNHLPLLVPVMLFLQTGTLSTLYQHECIYYHMLPSGSKTRKLDLYLKANN